MGESKPTGLLENAQSLDVKVENVRPDRLKNHLHPLITSKDGLVTFKNRQVLCNELICIEKSVE